MVTNILGTSTTSAIFKFLQVNTTYRHLQGCIIIIAKVVNHIIDSLFVAKSIVVPKPVTVITPFHIVVQELVVYSLLHVAIGKSHRSQ